jgi:uncharacterized protein involved in exopolysaccharide biosynthesis
MQAPEISQVSLRDVFIVIFKHKYLILLFFFAVVLTVSVGTFLASPTYEASAQILIKLGRESVFVPASADMRPVVNYNREERINSEIEILKSRSLAEKVVLALGPTVIYENLEDQKPGLIGRIKALIIPRAEKKLIPDERKELNLTLATSALQNSLEVEGVSKSNIVQVSFKHHDARMVAMVVNTLAEIYLDHHVAVHKTPRSYEFFQEQSENLKAQLTQSEETLKALKKQHNITSLSEERSLQLAQASQLRAEINKTSSQVIETEKRIRQIRKQLAATPRTISQGEETNSNQELIGRLEGRLVELELEEKQLLGKYTDHSRLVQHVREEIAIVKQKLAAQEKKSYGRKRSGVNPTYQSLQQELYRNEAELNALKAKGQTQKSQLADYQAMLEELNQIEVKINQLQQQVDVDRQNYRLYLAKFEESRISDAMDAERISSVSLLEPARQPMKPVSPKVMLNLLLAIFLGVFGGLGLAFLVDYLDDSLETVEAVEEHLQMPVLLSVGEENTLCVLCELE